MIQRCLAKEPADRFADVISLEQALGECQCAEGWSESKAAGWWKEHPERDVTLASELE